MCIKDNEILGQLFLSSFEEKKEVEISYLAVDGEHRRKKIASNIMNTALLFIKENYPTFNVKSYVDYDNEASLNLHKKFDFNIIGEAKNMGKEGCYILHCDLNKIHSSSRNV